MILIIVALGMVATIIQTIDICKNVLLYFSLPVIHLRKIYTFRCIFVQTPIWVMITRKHTNTCATRICALAYTCKLTLTAS